jgi:hypothetical protein
VAILFAGGNMKLNSNQTRLLTATLALDFAKGEDYMSAVMAKITTMGTVMIEQRFVWPRYVPTVHGLYDMMQWPVIKPPKNRRSRHHKAKAQPNCGPRGNNPW